MSPGESARNQAKFPPAPPSLAEEVLAHAQAGREVIQDFCPLADSLEWELGQEYLRRHKDYYDRLCYIAADRSRRMLLDVLRHGVLANHPGRCRVRLVDALEPDAALPGDVMFRAHRGRPLRAVFLNYLLDCLPAAV